jgi:hypothetical protein
VERWFYRYIYCIAKCGFKSQFFKANVIGLLGPETAFTLALSQRERGLGNIPVCQ